MSAGYVPQPDDEEIKERMASMGLAPGNPADAAAHEREVLASASGPVVGLPGGGVLGDVPPEIAATRALNFTPPVQPGAGPDAVLPMAPPPAQAPAPVLPAATPRAVAPRRTGGTPTAAPGLNTGGEERKLYDEQGRLQTEAITAEQKAGAVKNQLAKVESDNAQAEADRKAAAQAQQQQVIDSANQRTQQWADRAQAESEKYMKMDFHDYYADKSTGNKILSGLAMITGAIGRTDNSTNPGMKIINDAIERDFRMQQARIEKQKGNVAASRDQYELGLSAKQQALADNRLKEASAYDAAAAKAIALKMKMGVPLEQAQTDSNVVALKQKANGVRLETLKEIHGQNVQDEQLKISQGHLAVDRAKLGIERQKAGADKKKALEDKEVAGISREFDKDEARLKGSSRSPGLLARHEDIRSLGDNLRQAAASGDKQAMAAAIVAAKEKIARLNTGAAPSHEQMKMLNSLTGSPAEMQEKVSRMFGNPTVAKQTMDGVLKLVDQSDENALKELDKERGGLVQKYIGKNSHIATSSAQQAHAQARLAGLFGQTTTRTAGGEVPRYQEGGASATPPVGGGGRPPPEVIQAARAALQNPSESPARKDAARRVLLSIQGQ